MNLFQTRSSDVPWVVRLQWDSCLHDLSSMNFVVSHIYHEGNGVADSLAKFGAQNNDFKWWQSMPDFCTNILFEDFSVVERFQFC